MSTSQKKMTGGFFTEDLIHEQLQKIFLFPAFSVSDILRRFLSYIVQETLAGKSNTIKEYTIAVHVLNKPTSFKPQYDAIVRIHAGRLRRALNYYYNESGTEDKIEISVPKGSYVPVFERMQPKKPETNPKPSHSNNIFETVNLVVLPFITLETDISRMAFTDGLGQQLSAGLAHFPDFSVTSYFTTRQLSAKKKGNRELSSGFGAQYAITGNVQFENRKLRVAVQLINTQTGAQIWTELYDYTYTISGLFTASDEIIFRIVGALGDFNGLIIRQVSKGLAKNKSGQAYSTFLSHYHDFYFGFNEESFNKAYAAMETAVETNPYHDMAWSFLGQLSLLAVLFKYSTSENPLILCLRCARRALKINPLSHHGYLTLGLAQIFLGNRQESLGALENARRLNPCAAGLLGNTGCLMILAGEYDQGLALLEESMEMNKYFPPLFYLFSSLYWFKHKEYAKAMLEVEKSGMAEEALNILLRISILLKMGRKPEAETLVRSLKGYTLNKAWVSSEFISRFLLDSELVDQLTSGFKSVRLPLLTVA